MRPSTSSSFALAFALLLGATGTARATLIEYTFQGGNFGVNSASTDITNPNNGQIEHVQSIAGTFVIDDQNFNPAGGGTELIGTGGSRPGTDYPALPTLFTVTTDVGSFTVPNAQLNKVLVMDGTAGGSGGADAFVIAFGFALAPDQINHAGDNALVYFELYDPTGTVFSSSAAPTSLSLGSFASNVATVNNANRSNPPYGQITAVSVRVVPEPATLGLVALAGLGLRARRRAPR